MSPQWFLARDKQRYGPYALDQLRAMAVSGHVIPSDWLLQEGAQQWAPASSVDGVFPPTGATPPPIAQLARQQDGKDIPDEGRTCPPCHADKAKDQLPSDIWVMAKLMGWVLFGCVVAWVASGRGMVGLVLIPIILLITTIIFVIVWKVERRKDKGKK